MYRVGWFSTGRDKAALELLRTIHHAIRAGEIPAEMIFIFSNRERGESPESDKFLKLARDYNLPLITFSSDGFKPSLRREGRKNPDVLERWRREYDQKVTKLLSDYNPDLIILAGYMLIVSREFCQRYKMVNLHPALPNGPVGTWQEVIWKLIEERAAAAGAMMHLVTKDLDKGPPLTYFSFPLRKRNFVNLWEDLDEKLKNKTLAEVVKKEGEMSRLFQEIRGQGVIRELPLIFYTLKGLAEGRIRLEDNAVLVGGKLYQRGYCLNEEIEEYLKHKANGTS